MEEKEYGKEIAGADDHEKLIHTYNELMDQLDECMERVHRRKEECGGL